MQWCGYRVRTEPSRRLGATTARGLENLSRAPEAPETNPF